MKVLVIFHIFYPESASWYLEQMRNIHSCSWDLIVTGPSFSKRTMDAVLAVKPDAAFVTTENIGYDVWPFIAAFRTVKPAEYDIVVKLHTKKEDDYSISLNGMKVDGKKWRDLLVCPLLGSPKRFSKLLDAFGRHRNAGIAFNRQLGFRLKRENPEDCGMFDDEVKRLGMERRKCIFCSGTVFAAREEAIGFLRDERIGSDIFENSGPSHSRGTMAHVYERLIPMAAESRGYRYVPLYDSPAAAMKFRIKDVMSPALEWIFSVNRYGGKDRKLVTVFGKSFTVKA